MLGVATTKLTRAMADKAIEKHGSIRKASMALGCSRTSISHALQFGEATTHIPREVGPIQTISIEAVIKGQDFIGSAIKVINTLPEGQVATDEAIRHEINIGWDRWRIFRRSARLVGYWYKLPNNKYIWGTKLTIKDITSKLKDMA